jgi:hypothetical protein
MEVVKLRYIPYQYDSTYIESGVVKTFRSYRPKDGEVVVVTNSPYFSGYPVIVHGFNNNTIETLVTMAAQQATPQDVLAAISAETTARQTADSTLQGNIGAETTARVQGDITLNDRISSVENIALGANVALVFANKVQLDQWMAGLAVPGISYTPANLRNGWKALMRAVGEPDWWWDGNAGPPRWREVEVSTDLSAYRTATDQDAIDQTLEGEINEILDTYAPLESPKFTGIPETPRPDYSVLSQVADVYSILQLRDIVLNTILRGARAAYPDTPLLPHIRATVSNRIRGVYT